MGAQKKNAPAGVLPPVVPGLAAGKERLLPKNISAEPSQRDIARIYLELSKSDLENAKRNRSYYIGLAHRYGLSNVEIGEAVGVTEARVRAILGGEV